MKKSELNLMVIENFIDYFTTNDEERDEMKKVAHDYISEDWVDGKGNPEDDKQGLHAFSDSDIFSFLREERHKAFISWATDDVIGKANEIGFIMNEKTAIDIIGEIDRRADCELGITWETISYYVDEWIKKNSFEVVIVEASEGEERTTNFCSLETNENIEEFWNDDYYFYGLSKEEVKSFIGKGEMVGEAKIIKVI